MSYISTLNSVQKQNMNLIILSLQDSVIINIMSQASILAVSSKECEFKMAEEISYAHTPNDRIRAIFGSHFTGISDAAIDSLKADDKAFFDHVYGGMYGNKPDQGYLYRGRGFNEITFEGNYVQLNKDLPKEWNIDLINHPELLDKPEVAAKCLPFYFIHRFNSLPENVSADIHAKYINGFTNIEDAITGIYRANAGWGNKIFPDTTGGFAKAHARVGEFYELLTSKK